LTRGGTGAVAKGLREQVRVFLATNSFDFAGATAEFKKRCLSALKAARQAGRLSDDNLTAAAMRQPVADFRRYTEDAASYDDPPPGRVSVSTSCRTAGNRRCSSRKRTLGASIQVRNRGNASHTATKPAMISVTAATIRLTAISHPVTGPRFRSRKTTERKSPADAAGPR
jgi:hypothetical protein